MGKINRNCIMIRFFDETTHVEDFRSGIIRMMSAGYYSRLYEMIHEECNSDLVKDRSFLQNGRYDILECASSIYHPNNDGVIEMENSMFGNYRRVKLYPGGTYGPLIIRNDESDKNSKILSLYSIDRQEHSNKKILNILDEKVLSFGDYYCLILNQKEFSKAIFESIQNLHINNILKGCMSGFVDYVDISKLHGYYGHFNKPKSFSWQNEVRLVIQIEASDPFRLGCKDLHDFTIWGKTSDLLCGEILENEIIVPNFYN